MRALFPAVLASLLAACSADPAVDDDAAADEAMTVLYETNRVDFAKSSHLIIVGNSDELGTQPFQAGLARARRYHELNPERPIVLFVTRDVAPKTAARFGEAVLVVDKSRLEARKLVREFSRFEKIASIDFYGHSNPWAALLETDKVDDRRLNAQTPGMAALAERFDRSADPHVSLDGCNGAISVAPSLSKMWRVPVSGGLTGSTFEQLTTSGRFSTERGPGWASVNSVSFTSPQPCSEGACYRMRPQNTVYHGHWGNFRAGLGFYKTLCDFDGDDACYRGMAESLLSFPSVVPLSAADIRNNRAESKAKFQRIVLDFLCPAGERYADCATKLPAAAAANQPYSAFQGKEIACSMRACDIRFTCKNGPTGPKPGSCVLDDGPANATPMAMVLDYQHYMRGFDLLAR